MQPLLIIQTDDPAAEASRTTAYLRQVILGQGVGIDPMRVVIDPPSLAAYENVPVLTMGKLSMAAWMGGEKRISEYHGHVHYFGKTLVGHTFDTTSAIKQSNYLPVIIQEISNLLQAARNPIVLDRPVTYRELPFSMSPDGAVLDLEWDGKNRVTVVGFATCGEDAYSTRDVQAGLTTARSCLDIGIRIIGHNVISADLPHVGKPRSYSPEHVFDTKIAAHIVHPHFAGQGLYDLGSLVRFYFPTTDWKHDQHELMEYNGLDCAYNWRLYEALVRDLQATGQYHLMQEEQELHAITCTMRDRGCKVDKEALAEAVDEKSQAKNALKAGLSFNPGSPIQVRQWLKDQGFPVANAQEKTLEKLRGKSDAIDTLIAFRVDSKAIKTWYPHERDKRGNFITCNDLVHPKFDVCGTAVARLNCSNPNWQNIPPSLRHIIVPRSLDLELLAVDAMQAENRWIAHYAQDDKMLAGFDSGLDNHQIVADNLSAAVGFTVSRAFGKSVVHATNYGETPTHLAERLCGNRKGESIRMAKALQDGYFKAYPATARWQTTISKQLDAGDLRLVNAYGRVRYIYAADSHERKKKGCHYLGCSTAADMVNRKVTQIYRELGLVPILIVHDEIVWEVKKGTMRAEIAEILRQPVKEQGGRAGAWEMKAGGNYGKWSETNVSGLRKVEMV